MNSRRSNAHADARHAGRRTHAARTADKTREMGRASVEVDGRPRMLSRRSRLRELRAVRRPDDESLGAVKARVRAADTVEDLDPSTTFDGAEDANTSARRLVDDLDAPRADDRSRRAGSLHVSLQVHEIPE